VAQLPQHFHRVFPHFTYFSAVRSSVTWCLLAGRRAVDTSGTSSCAPVSDARLSTRRPNVPPAAPGVQHGLNGSTSCITHGFRLGSLGAACAFGTSCFLNRLQGPNILSAVPAALCPPSLTACTHVISRNGACRYNPIAMTRRSAVITTWCARLESPACAGDRMAAKDACPLTSCLVVCTATTRTWGGVNCHVFGHTCDDWAVAGRFIAHWLRQDRHPGACSAAHARTAHHARRCA
jgi:hypothetical protein